MCSSNSQVKNIVFELQSSFEDYDGRARPAAKAALLARIIEESVIELPASRDDPQGNFTRYNYPDNITKADALAMALEIHPYRRPPPRSCPDV